MQRRLLQIAIARAGLTGVGLVRRWQRHVVKTAQRSALSR
jgi:hypothetical protein